MQQYNELTSIKTDGFLGLDCPADGCNNLHISSVSEGKTNDIYKDDTVKIDMYSECGYRMTLVLYTHKGSTYMGWKNVEEMPDEEDNEPPEDNSPPDEELASQQEPTPDPEQFLPSSSTVERLPLKQNDDGATPSSAANVS